MGGRGGREGGREGEGYRERQRQRHADRETEVDGHFATIDEPVCPLETTNRTASHIPAFMPLSDLVSKSRRTPAVVLQHIRQCKHCYIAFFFGPAFRPSMGEPWLWAATVQDRFATAEKLCV